MLRSSWVVLSVALACAAPASSQAANAVNGKQLYEGICSGCHTAGGGGNAVVLGAGNPNVILAATGRIGDMLFLRDILQFFEYDDLAAYLLLKFGPQPGIRVPVVEFHHATLDHYFISSLQPDIDALDSGRLQGWARTGLTFNAWPPGPFAPPTGSNPVCRFYLPPANGDSHFYSASPAECSQVADKFPTFSFESPEVMYVILPDIATGACPPNTSPVYRVWNQRVDSNHRYTTDLAVREQMIARGYIGEGYGPDAVVMCSPN